MQHVFTKDIFCSNLFIVFIVMEGKISSNQGIILFELLSIQICWAQNR